MSSSMSHLKKMLWKWTKCGVLPSAGTHLVFLILCVHTLIVFVHKGYLTTYHLTVNDHT